MPKSQGLSPDSLISQFTRGDEGWCAQYHDINLSSTFQPVISITHKRVVGYEALVRATDANGAPISPDTLFARAQARGETILLDRLTRCLHAANFSAQDTGMCWLFLNVLPQMFDAGIAPREFIEALCAHFSLPPTRIVLEVIEQPSRNEAALAHTLDMIQHGDFLIAIDDFGTGFSNFDRIWQMKPDIVKLDRSIVERSLAASDAHRIVHHLVTMLHHAGTMVLAEGVENEDALQILMDADVDFVQGFCFGQPDPSLERARRYAPARIEAAWARFAERAQERRGGAVHPGFDTIERIVLAGAADYTETQDLRGAAQRLLTNSIVRRVFVAEANGEQIEPSVTAETPDAPSVTTRRLAPLLPELHCNWSRRAYFQRAVAAPGRVALMGPHFSLTDGRDCYTAAVAIHLGTTLKVFCVDFDFSSSDGDEQ
ncbi:EAL domain-containing protein [Burkholderia oklahomensis]|uniref:EAL domain protein n=1 Tax=Burkholderia oklahomensis TaxID=342113 RepID=A0AAI8FMY9_9BURK|nr:EAL domain-containing protein [Burkholderia oklahomensis]AIO66320.1 EAL domain protein [Burkholderia oklahomensis]AJX30207.1 EAL domain protein [Burkholderia oklahomensis C6786]AOI42943.1 diguanylate phosphodiesterase [Burkholderia oklahomensis EO147]AOI46498.1 diguanylate phosphodiesterase [Burkholderia oklahomensis C6786]KUY56421.1 diguanylate phosphodiesterase [Burkholderia oklahomensis C6786]